ncbi:Aste57867_17105 [Aphanomyces stellatus]|uniref:Aste57867_17105 protein n=1 Tax=Aphanomyces stellatus TaxID=120398 RepID=A0A485L703_9STRA|nr:hypothetical protein As57867_017046 [Aphanomyces stellatus]VFT93863.1 Aste57867_17105 [Aphanomyces stellatus]
MKLLLADLPVQLQEGVLVPRHNHTFSWSTFMDVTHPIEMSVRQSCVESIIQHPTFASTQGLLRELAFAEDKHGREVIQITDQETRKYFYDRLFFCGRYEIFPGPPVHVSNTSVVVMAYDHGICAQMFQEYKNANDGLDVGGFIKCNKNLGYKREKEKWQAEFCLWDKDKNESLSEKEFLNYCGQYLGGKVQVAMKFMRNSNEYNREIKTREQLKSDFMLRQLPSVEQTVFQNHLPALSINGDFSMAEYRQVLVMPAADRSLEDIHCKERPDDNKTKGLLKDVLLAIQSLHEHGFVHGDLKKLNVLRVQNQLKLIDFDAAVRKGQPLGAKISSGILPPEMIQNLETADDLTKYNTYWGNKLRDSPKRKKTQVKSNYVVKSYRDDCDVSDLPYSPIKATPSVDMWSFGCMVFQMLCGQELVPTDINQNVVLDFMQKAATWTDDKLRQRIENFISDDEAQNLVIRLLVVDPALRLSATEALNHPYFTGIRDTSAMDILVEEMAQTQEAMKSKLVSLNDTVTSHIELQEQAILEVNTAIAQLGNDVVHALMEASDVVVPTSFVILPCKSLTKDTVDATKVTSFLAHLWDTGKKLQAVKGRSVNDIVSKLCDGAPLYLYLIDEATDTVVVPEEKDSIYPIKIPAGGDNSFLLMNLPFIQNTFKSLKKGAATVGCLHRLHLLPSLKLPKGDKETEQTKYDWTQEIERAITDLSEPTVSFQVLQQALEEPVTLVRGAALRELKQVFNEHDPSQSFSGLTRVITNQGRVIWTSKVRVLAMEEEANKAANKTIDRIREKLKQATP